eukprot:549735-Alexandrium_andersonii.AAC.1
MGDGGRHASAVAAAAAPEAIGGSNRRSSRSSNTSNSTCNGVIACACKSAVAEGAAPAARAA